MPTLSAVAYCSKALRLRCGENHEFASGVFPSSV